MAWNKITNPIPDWVKTKISNTNKLKGIKPPSRKGLPFQYESYLKLLKSRKNNGKPWHSTETINKIQNKRKLFYDKLGRKTNLSDRLKKTEKYKLWRKSVFERDNYTCQECGKKGVYLQAHHIFSKSKLIELNNNDYDKCIKDEKMWEVSNGLTLCKICHKKTESYGVFRN